MLTKQWSTFWQSGKTIDPKRLISKVGGWFHPAAAACCPGTPTDQADLDQTNSTGLPFMISYRRSLFLLGALLQIGIAYASGLSTATHAKARTSPNTFKVLFIGNSHLLVNNVPARVQRRLRTAKGQARIRTFAYGGARLLSFTRRADVASALRTTNWNIVVLQEASATFLTAHGRRNFQRAVRWFQRNVPAGTRIVLYQTWPWRSGSRYLGRSGSSSAKMWSAMQTEYSKPRRTRGVTIAPVGSCWVRSPRRAKLYSADGNHATVAGSRLAAAVISTTIIRGAHGNC